MKRNILIVCIYMTCNAQINLLLTPLQSQYRSLHINQACHIGGGFFCELGGVLTSLIHYEQEGIHSLYVDWTNQFFPYKINPYENGWDLYFEPIPCEDTHATSEQAIQTVGNTTIHEMHDQLCVAPWLRYEEYLPYRLFVNEKIKKYIHIKKTILDQVDSFYEHTMKSHVCIGVHVRYAHAHTHESPGGHPSLHEYCIEINKLLQKHADEPVKIFLATDSNAVVEHFKKKYRNKLVYIDTYRAKNTEDPSLIYERERYWTSHIPEWHKAKPGYQGGLGALMDCLLLARCDYLIHIMSNLSTFVCFFNPYIHSIYLPRDVIFDHCRYQEDTSIRNPYINPIS